MVDCLGLVLRLFLVGLAAFGLVSIILVDFTAAASSIFGLAPATVSVLSAALFGLVYRLAAAAIVFWPC